MKIRKVTVGYVCNALWPVKIWLPTPPLPEASAGDFLKVLSHRLAALAPRVYIRDV